MKKLLVKSWILARPVFLFQLFLPWLLAVPARAAEWLPFGPYGGDARAFAADPKDPKHIYLGTANGWIYDSEDNGGSWKRLARVGKRDDLVLDHIEVDRSDSKHLLVGVWVLGKTGGGMFQSRDQGRSWTEIADLSGQSVRSLAGSPSDPKMFVAGTLEGIYRSVDGGEHWKLISPEKSQEIHEVESVAIDPKNPSVIYAGTWHLPWRTSDGGEHWNNMKEGLIDDSDVFSIIVDPKDPKIVYLSACSGIYKSDSGGDKFLKVQGIPSTARRTRVLLQDPSALGTVYAGTTEGLFRTMDAGKAWGRTTGPEVIVNDVLIDPSNTKHVLIATDRGGVLASEDGGTSFQASNAGFTVRQVASYAADARSPATLYISVLNDKTFGGVFESKDGSLSWVQNSAGLDGRDVYSLGQSSDGTMIAGTGHGIYRLKDATWSRVDDVMLAPPAVVEPKAPAKKKASRVSRKGSANGKVQAAAQKRLASAAPVHGVGVHAKPAFDGGVFAISAFGDTTYAATGQGLLSSATAGQSWQIVAGLEPQSYQFVSSEKGMIAVANLHALLRSTDGGASWTAGTLPQGLTQVTAMTVDDAGGVWIGGREGIWISGDAGANWMPVKDLFVQDVSNIFFDRGTRRVYVAGGNSTHLAYMVQLPDLAVRFWDTGWNLKFVRPMGDHLVGATLFDGMVVQPRMVDSLEVKQ